VLPHYKSINMRRRSSVVGEKVMKYLLLVGSLMLLLLVACGGATAAPGQEIDLTSLGRSVDVTTTHALLGSPDVFLLDVREPDEYDAGHIPGITLIPMGDVADRLAEIPKDQTVIVTCRTGNRSGQIADFLRDQGYTDVHNMEGGIVAWEEAGLPIEQ
jgi:rhodanese-related sulfurtransferase